MPGPVPLETCQIFMAGALPCPTQGTRLAVVVLHVAARPKNPASDNSFNSAHTHPTNPLAARISPLTSLDHSSNGSSSTGRITKFKVVFSAEEHESYSSFLSHSSTDAADKQSESKS